MGETGVQEKLGRSRNLVIGVPMQALPNSLHIKIESEKIKSEIGKILDDSKVGERIREGFKIAIIGPSNAGKSSLLN